MAALVTSSQGDVTLSSAVTIPQPKTINSINDFVVHQAQIIPDTPLIAYPASEQGASDFENYTAKDLDVFADEVARTLASHGLVPNVSFLVSYEGCS
jgi:hypothetical protein